MIGLIPALLLSTTVTVQVPKVKITPVIPVGTTLCTVPKTGGACKTATSIALAPIEIDIPNIQVPVGGTYMVVCSIDTPAAVAEDGTIVLPPMTCLAVPKQ